MLSVIFCAHILCFIVSVLANPRVTAKTGIYEGTFEDSGNGTYQSFKGIKFADIKQRFKEATVVKDSNETLSAKNYGPSCVQADEKGMRVLGQEDCLYLNVYSCSNNTSSPVIVFIHGGGFVKGNSRFGEKWFMQSCEIVYVMIQYRLGPYGLLHFNSPNYPSNLALRDQITALKWVNRNIQFFGGDPAKVTIQGQSAGASSVHLLMQSPLTKGLFRAGISESGTGCVPWAIASKERARLSLTVFTKLTICNVTMKNLNDSMPADSAAECLSTLSSEIMLQAAKVAALNLKLISLPFEPVLDGEGQTSVITNYSWLKPVPGQVPWISGVNSAEGETLANLVLKEQEALILSLLANIYLPDVFDYRETSRNPDIVTSQIRKYYHGEGALTPNEIQRFIRQIITDNNFVHPNYLCQKLHTESTTYNYEFAKSLPGSKRTGVGHAEELLFLFNFAEGNISLVRNATAIDDSVSKRMVKLWTSFAVNLIPVAEGVSWDQWSKDKNNVLIIGQDGSFTMNTDPNMNGIKFWNNLPFRDKFIPPNTTTTISQSSYMLNNI